MTFRTTWIAGAVAVSIGLAAVIAASPVRAGSDYSGRWAADLANCRTPQERADAPLILSPKGYDQHESHCKFKSVKESGAGEWVADAECSVEGDSLPMTLDLTVSGDTLTIKDSAGARDLLRCP